MLWKRIGVVSDRFNGSSGGISASKTQTGFHVLDLRARTVAHEFLQDCHALRRPEGCEVLSGAWTGVLLPLLRSYAPS